MPLALVETKFFHPRPRPGLVPRPRLDQVLGTRRTRLTLVSAPAGFGKTTLLAAWLAGAPEGEAGTRRIAWVSLDEADTDAAAFWAYVLTALERAVPGSGAEGLALLEAGQPVETVLATVLNELSVLPDDVDLVLDDYHLAEGPEIQPGVAFLLEHLPPQVHLVISTRADPALPLARLRARGELTEVRAADLRFTARGGDRLPGRGHRAASWTRTTSRPWRPGPRAGSRPCSSPRSRCATATTRRASSPASPATTGTSWTTSWRRSWTASPQKSATSCSHTAILDRLTGPLCDAVTETSGEQPGAGVAGAPRTCSWCRSTTDAAGTATTTCSPTFSGRTCSASNPTGSPGCTGAPATGTTRPGSPNPRSGTRSPPATSRERRKWLSSRSRSWAGYAARRCSGAGSTPFRTRCSGTVRSWPSAWSAP